MCEAVFYTHSNNYLFQTLIIEDCQQCRSIVIGPVRHTAVFRRLNRCNISICCRRLLIEECVDCILYVSSYLQPFMIGTRNVNIIFAPYNAYYEVRRDIVSYTHYYIIEFANGIIGCRYDIGQST